VCPYLDAPNRLNDVMLQERGHIYLSRGVRIQSGAWELTFSVV